MILFRPFQFQLWIFIVAAYCVNWIFDIALPRKPTSIECIKILALSLSLFTLCEFYAAKLIAFLNSPIDTVYPKSLEEFRSSSLRLITQNPQFLVYLETIPVLRGKYALYNKTLAYDWNQLALIDRCNIFKDKTVPEPQGGMGVVLSSSKYHVIDQPLAEMKFPLLFNKRSPLGRTTRRIINQISEVGLWRGMIKRQKLKAGKSTEEMEVNVPDAFYGFMPIYYTLGKAWIISLVLFVLQWIYVKYLRQIQYNLVILIGLSAFLRN